MGKRILFIINTSAQVYTWKYIIQGLIDRGHNIKIIARDYGSTLKILDSFVYEYRKFKPVGSRSGRFLGAIDHFQKCYQLGKKCAPSMIIGFGIDNAITAARLRKPSIIFNDSEPIGIQNSLITLFASTIITPSCFRKNLGKKQIRINGYKELAYLQPNYFRPDPAILDELKLKLGEKYVILRFNAFDAVHDIGKHGFSVNDQFKLVKELEKYARVFISPEKSLPEELESYRLPVASDKIHHVLCYAQLLITDTQTMATEAAILGTPVVRCNNFVGPHDMGNFVELEKKYDLIYSFQDTEKAIHKAIELIQKPGLKEEWSNKRQKLLNDKIDFTRFMINFIDDYPNSLKNIKRKMV